MVCLKGFQSLLVMTEYEIHIGVLVKKMSQQSWGHVCLPSLDRARAPRLRPVTLQR